MLISAAAARWNLDPSTCSAQRSEVVHAATGRRLGYGELAGDAAHMPVPTNVALKSQKDFRLIGTPAKRLDLPAKVNGTAVFGIDARPPGVKIATLAQPPVFGRRVKRVDDNAARAIKGVRQIVRLEDAVAVVADHMRAAKNGRVEQANFDTYQLLRMNEAPAVEVYIVQSSEAPGGMGEAETSLIVPAVANAIFAATGKRLRKLPVDPTVLKQQG
ncbi:MAG: hypothetical protein KK478_12475 [Ensifer alkalisoli]|nr:hypothetical protein [Sinorhizobium alkalisoli]